MQREKDFKIHGEKNIGHDLEDFQEFIWKQRFIPLIPDCQVLGKRLDIKNFVFLRLPSIQLAYMSIKRIDLFDIWNRMFYPNSGKETSKPNLQNGEEIQSMGPEIHPPKFLSLEFHTRFFPRFLRDRLRRQQRERRGATFTSTTEMLIGLAAFLILAILGIPLAWAQGSIAGWVLSIVGVGGIVGLVILSIGGQWRDRPTYDNFLIGVFLFFVSLGLFVGIPIGMDRRSFWLGVSVSLAGLAGGYGLGIFAGLGLQRLGWLAVVINMLAALAAIVLGGTALILLLVLVS